MVRFGFSIVGQNTVRDVVSNMKNSHSTYSYGLSVKIEKIISAH